MGEGAEFKTKTELDPLIVPDGISESTKVGVGGRFWTVVLNALTFALKLFTVVLKLFRVVLELFTVVVRPFTVVVRAAREVLI